MRTALRLLLLLVAWGAFDRTDAWAQSVTGTVFEDVNYGGGSGRTLGGSSGVARPGATVELYNAAGNYVSSTTTNASGVYTFAVAAGNYTVRVVNSTVTSSRTGATAALVPVQTYNGTTTRVGGEAPAKTDVGAAAPSNGIGTGTALVRFEGGVANGDNTAFVDLVEVLNSGGTVVTGAANNSFETPDYGNAAASYAYNPTVAATSWTFNAQSGIAATGSSFNVPAPLLTGQGDQVAFLQTLGNAQPTVQQGFTLPAGTYTIRFQASQRNGGNTVNQTVRVLVNGTQVLASFAPSTPVLGTLAYTQYTTASFTIFPTLASLTTATAAPQSIAAITVTGTAATTADFGYNFDTVVNTNDTGQGSLRQFVLNANALGGEGSLAQSGSRTTGAGATAALAAGVETSIFMVPDNQAHNGQLAGLGNALTAGTAIITTASALTVTGANAANTAIDGGTQTFNIGATAPGTVTGTSTTTVGIDGLAVTALNVPEVEISGNNINTVIDFETTNDVLRGVAVHGGTGGQAVFLGSTASAAGYLIENALVGVVAAGTRPTVANTITSGYGIYPSANAGVGTVQNSFIAYTGISGISLNNSTGTTGTTQILGNQFLQNGYTNTGGDGITLGDNGGSGPVLVQGNLITNPNATGIQFEIGSTSLTRMLNNTITGAGTGGAAGSTSLVEGAGIGYLQRDGTKRGASLDVISKNIITNAQYTGVVIGYGQQNVTISQNSIFNSSTGLGIDLIANANYYVGSGNAAGAANYANGDGVTVNDGNDPAAAANTLPNRGVDFPVLTSATVSGTNLVVKGYARPGAVIEFFNPGTPDPSGFGEGQTYLSTLTAPTTPTTGSYNNTTVSNPPQGTDAAAVPFTFTIPLTGNYAGYAAGFRLTSTATLNNSTSELSGNVVVSSAPVPNTLTNASSIPNAAGATPLNPGLSGTANGTLATGTANSVAYYTLASLPAAGTLTYNGTVLTAGNIAATQITNPALLTYSPSLASAASTVSFTYSATDANGIVSTTNNNGGTVTNGPATYTIPLSPTGAAGTPAACANPGRDGSPTGLTTNPNTYYPSTAGQILAAGATSIAVGVATGTGNIAAGDLLLVIQMQGADINTTNTDAYGDGVAGGGANGNLNNANFTAGTYEYVVANSAVTATAGGNITLATALKNGYVNAVATATTGQRSFQVIRVPQFGNLTLGGNITPTPWNGSVGGIIAIDVAKQTNLNGFTIDASGAGFRGGAGRTLNGNNAATSADYRFLSGTQGSTSGAHGSKGEGTAGTPAFVNSGATAGFTNGTGAFLATGTDYPSGSNGRGAPGNAGGGGTDNLGSTDNSENSGGAGGANGGAGGRGGNTWNSNLAIGGEPGAAFAAASSSRLVLGGGGGAGSTNNATGTPNAGFASSGAAGGGLVMLRTGTVSGTGTILANGLNANNSVANDGSGGGGAGGSILLTATTPAGLANITLTANGGTGGTNTGGGVPHGPGGGGGGGVILTNGSTAAASTATGAAAGTTNGGTSFGAAPGLTGDANAQISNSVANSVSGANCPADVTTTITGPTTLSVNQPAGSAPSYTATFTNNGTGAASNVTQTVTLPAGATVTAANLPTGATFTTTGTGATAVTTVNFGTVASLANGASNSFAFSFTAPATAGSYPLTTNVATDANQGTNTAADAATLTIQVNNAPANCAKSYYDNTNSYSGLSSDYYPTDYSNNIALFNTNTPTDKAIAPTVNYSRAGANTAGSFPVTSATLAAGNNVFSARYRGNITLTTAGSYTIYVSADDQAQAWIDGAAVGAPNPSQSIITTDYNTRPGTKTLNLSAGQHNILIYYYAKGQPDDISLSYSGPDTNGATVIIPNSALCAGLGNIPPIANNGTNVNIPNNAGPITLSPSLSGTDQDGSVVKYAIATLPLASQGILRLNGMAVTAGQVITAAQAAQLTFQPVNTFTGNASFTFSAIDNSPINNVGQYSNEVATYTIPVVLATTIAGTVFEDANYGGGRGRNLGTTGTVGRAGATVELYDASGNFVSSTTTAANGTYSLGGATAAGNYTVRVVNSTVTSARTGAVAGLLPVQTFVRNGTTDNVNRVGGEAPEKQDAAANTGSQTLGALTAGTLTPESITTVSVANASTPVSTVDFGFNFDVVTNTNDTGQGSLRQFILNSNALGGEASLAPVYTSATGATTALTTALETSIFMIPNGTAVAGLRTGLVSGFSTPNNGSGTAATITVLTVLPNVTGPATAIDGRTQTRATGDSNLPVTTAGSESTGPEVLINGNNIGLPGGIAFAGNGDQLLGMGVYGSNNPGNSVGVVVLPGATGVLIQGNTINNNGANINFQDNSATGNAASAATVSGNIIRDSQRVNADGIELNGNNSNLTISGNQFLRNYGYGIDFVSGANTGNTITNNTFVGNGTNLAGAAGYDQMSGIGLRGNGSNNNTISNNTFANNNGAGIVALSGTTGNVFSQNSFFGNGVSSGTGLGLAIDLTAGNNNNGDGVTINDNGDGDTGANGLLNFPVITSSTIVGTNLVVTGYARPGSLIELYSTGAPDPTGFGEGRTYLGTVTEGGTAGATAGTTTNLASDTNTGTGTYGPGNVNGLSQGTDNTNLFTFTIPLTGSFAGLTAGTVLTSTATLGGNTSEFSGNVAVNSLVTGYVYEDANYGGGTGRSRTALGAAAVGRAGALVELYDNTGTFVTSAITDTNGQYMLPVAPNANYTVRVVDNTVTSARTGATFTGSATTGYVSDQLAVQTYNGTTDRVGGEAPQKADAAAGTTGTTLASLNTATTVAESQFAFTAGTGGVTTGPDFGFNFDVVTNTNDAGQGSLRQFITNSNALGGEASLAQSGSNGAGTLVAGRETSIFMIPTSSAVAGQRAGLVSGLTGGVAVITPATALPAISGPNTAIDGTTQTFNEGNTNNVLLGAGGTVGTGATALSQVNGPEVQLVGSSSIGIGLSVAAAGTGTSIIGLSVYGFGNNGDADTSGEIVSSADNFAISKSVIGSTAKSFTNPSIPNTGTDIRIVSGTGVVITNNLVGFSTNSGIRVASVGATVTNNEIRSNALVATNFDGLQVRGSGIMATGNLFINNSGQGVDAFNSTGANNLSGNTLTGNGVGNTTSAPTETAAIRVIGTGNTVSQNIINANYGAGVQVVNNATGVITQNSIYDNGTITSANGTAASGQIGIDLENAVTGAGTAPYVTINDNGDGDTGGNGLLNFPVITSSTIVGTNLVVTGYARPGSVIELFGTGTPDPTGFGEGRTYLGTFTEGSAADTNTGTGTYGPGNVNGLNQGTDNTNLFTFTIPLTGSFAGLTAGTVLTSTATLSGATSEFSGNVQVVGADVTTTITGPNTLAAGQPSGTFTVAFSNVGSGAATAVAQTVALPANATLTTAQQNAITAAYPGTTFSTAGNVTTITFPQAATLAAGATNLYQFAFTAPTASGATSIVSNVSAPNEGSNIAPNMASFALTVTDVADVAATIVGTGAPVAAGATGTFTATFTNNGPSSAANTRPTVQLVPGLTNVTLGGNGPTSTTGGISTYANGSTYNSNTGLFVGPTLTLTSGQSTSLTIGYTQPAQGNVTATAAVTTTTSQAGQTANDSQSATNMGGPGFDLATTLAGPSSAVAGTQVTYAVTTLNNGPGAAPSALQTVSIPTTAALTNVFLTNGGTYSFSNGTSVFSFPAIPALGSGQQTNNSISFTSPASGASSLVVTSLVTPNTPTAGDANTMNNQASITTNLTAAPAAAGNTANLNVAIASNAPTSGVAAGSTVVFTVTQGNNGPNAATNVATQVYLPAGLSGVVVKDKNGNVVANSATTGYNAATGVVILPTETSEASASTPLTYTISATAPAMGVITATASVSAGTNDPVAADNVAITQVTVNTPLVSDVATSLSGPAVAAPGESITYTVTSTNNSTTPATGVTQTVQLPAGLSGVVVKDANNNVVANSATTGYNAATGLVTFATQATLGAGSSVTRTITLPAPSNAGSATGGSIVPVASVTSTSNDNVQANNSASMTTTIVPVSDFVVSLSGPASIVAGNPVTYTVATTNNGPSVGGQQTSVQLPAGLSGVLVGGSGPTSTTGATATYANGATYNSTTGVLTLPALAAQGLGTANAQSNVITFNAPTNVVELTPTAQVTPTAGSNDANLSNNAATATTTVTPATTAVIDLATTVTSNAPSNTQTAGQPIIFTVTSTNNTTGSSATGVVQQLSLAAGLTGVLIDGSSPTSTTNGIATYAGGATYNANTGVVTFASATVANGTPATHTVQAAAPGSGPLVATAAIKGDQSDNTPANNTNSTTVTITPSADLVTSTTGPTATQPGTPVSYSVVTTNNGPSAAANVVPTITLPTGATNVVLPPGATLSGNVVTFATVGNLANGQAATNTVTFTSPATAGSYTVSSSSSSTAVGATPATADPSTGNNASSLATTNTAPTAVPVAFNVVSQTAYNATNGTYGSPGGNTAGANLISPLSAAASSGQSVAKYTITTIPTAAQGTLYYNTGTAGAPNYQAVGLNQDLTPAQAASLRFDPADNATTTASVGDISFAYTATDNLGKLSNTALYTIPVSQDNQSLYATTPVKGGAVVYQNNDVIAYVVDPNGAAYDSNGLIYQTTGANAGQPVNAMSPVKNGVAAATTTGVFTSSSTTGVTSLTDLGLTYDPTTGAISVLDRTKLKAGTYTLNMTTTDLFGGITTQPVTFTIGAMPLPITLVAFTAEAVQNRDALLKWTTASELNNDHFEVERSLDGTSYAKIGQVQGQGSKSSPTAYTLTDAAVAAKAAGQVYYRLKQVDINGAASYSPVRTVSFTKVTTPAIALYPNPATTATQLDLTQLPTGTYQVSLLDATGRVVLRAEHEAGLSYGLDLTMLATGTYTVLVRGQHDGEIINLTKRLIKE